MVKKIYRTLVFGFIFLSIRGLYAQDVHFSMFDMSPLNLNPAHTGMMDGDKRIANIFRTQWKAVGDPLKTYSISYDQKLYFLPNNFSAGLIFVTDKSGGIDLTENKFILSTAAQFFRGYNTFSVGFQAGFVSKVWSLGESTFPEQYNRESGRFDFYLPNGESNYKLARGYIDLAIGGIWKRPTQKGTFLTGASVYHINGPNDSFFQSGDGLKPRLVLHSNYDMKISSKWFIKPSVLFMSMQKAQDLLITANSGIVMKENPLNLTKAWFGFGVRTGVNRNGDSAIPTLGCSFKTFDVAAAYDINFSELKLATNNRGAFEIAIIYTSRSTAINKTTIPCDRF